MPSPLDDLKSAMTQLAASINLLLDAMPHSVAIPEGVVISPADLSGMVKQLGDLASSVNAAAAALAAGGMTQPVPVEPESPPPGRPTVSPPSPGSRHDAQAPRIRDRS